jgi:ribosomal protein L35AE/L33A
MEERHVKIRAKDEVLRIKIVRAHGSDGIVKCNYETIVPQSHEN